jgi:dihydrofolate reductase
MATDRKLIVTENMTVDGVIDATEGWFSAAGADEGDDSADLVATLRKHMKAQDGLVLGRVTFESFREYWPKQREDTTGITDHLNHVQKYVFSSTLEDPQWDNSIVVDGDLVDEVRALKKATVREESTSPNLEFVDAETFRSGVVLLTYRAA